MRLLDTIAIMAGGPGSGCHGDNCGRPRTRTEEPESSRAPGMVRTFSPGYQPPHKLNGIMMKEEKNPDFSKGVNKEVTNEQIKLPNVPDDAPKGFSWRASAGVIIVEPDNRAVWLYDPSNQFGGYRTTFPKGTVESGEDVQRAALREVWEETGLVAKITGHLGDYQRSNSVTRYYIGERTGGAPWRMGWEAQAVRLVLTDREALKKITLDVDGKPTIDHQIIDDLMKKVGK